MCGIPWDLKGSGDTLSHVQFMYQWKLYAFQSADS